MITDFSYTTQWALTDLLSWICWNRLFSRSPFISALRATHSGLSSNTGTFCPKLLINSLLVNYRVKLTGTSREECIGSTASALKLGRSIAPSSRPFQLAVCVLGTGKKFYVDTRFWHTGWDPTIVMTVHNNNDILMLHYEDLPDGDKGIINKAIEEFQNKCLLSYTKTRDNTIV